MKKIKYKVLTPQRATIQYYATPEFHSKKLYFNYLMREAGHWLNTNLNEATIFIKELNQEFVTDEEGSISLKLKNGVYHAKIVDWGKTDVQKQFVYMYWPTEKDEVEKQKSNLLKLLGSQKFVVNVGNYYYAEGSRPTKIQKADIPEYYVEGYAYHMSEVFVKAKDVKDIAYKRSKITPESFKDDVLYISYDKPIKMVKDAHGWTQFENADVTVFGVFILDFVEGMKKWSPDVKAIPEIEKELAISSEMHKAISEAEKEGGWEKAEELKREYIEKMLKKRDE